MNNETAKCLDCSPQAPLSRGVFLIKESNLSLSRCRQILYHLSHQGSPLPRKLGPGLESCLPDLLLCEPCAGCPLSVCLSASTWKGAAAEDPCRQVHSAADCWTPPCARVSGTVGVIVADERECPPWYLTLHKEQEMNE